MRNALLSSVMVILSLSGWAAETTASQYRIRGFEFEGCECHPYCPCIFQKDATMDQCRGVMAWKVETGRVGKTDLSGTAFAISITKSGKNLEKAMGSWEGVLFVPKEATQAKREAIENVLKAELGPAFSKLEVRPAEIAVQRKGSHYELSIQGIATLKINALKGANGRTPVIENPPSPLALEKTYYAQAETHTYDDGQSKWDFAGRNGFFGPFEFSSRKALAAHKER